MTVADRLADVRALVGAEPEMPGSAHGMLGLLQRLCSAVVRALPASGAGVTVMTDAGARGVAVASDEASERIDELQLTLGEGPCMDAFSFRRPVLEADLERGGMNRWPAYAAAAHREGVRAVFAFPLQIGAARLGVLDVYREHAGSLSAEAIAQALTFADVATEMLLDGQEHAEPGRIDLGLDEAMEYRFEVLQAQGMAMVQLGVSLGDALARMRAYAFAQDLSLSRVARDVVTRRLEFERDAM
jgi:hypothetical protein